MLRHSCAVALLQAGVDVSVIRDYLGHASVATTSRYITTNLQMKRQVLDAFWKRAGLAPTGARKWQPSPKLLGLPPTALTLSGSPASPSGSQASDSKLFQQPLWITFESG